VTDSQKGIARTRCRHPVRRTTTQRERGEQGYSGFSAVSGVGLDGLRFIKYANLR
jgi:hypothetical protein